MKHFRLGCCSLPRLRWRAAAVSLMVIAPPTINAYCVFFNILGHFDADGTSVATLVDILILQLDSHVSTCHHGKQSAWLLQHASIKVCNLHMKL
jgi:hypothetical protein